MTCLSRAVGALTLIATSLVAQNIGGAIQQPNTGNGSSGLTIGTTTISGGGTNAILYGDGSNLQNDLGFLRAGIGKWTIKDPTATTGITSFICQEGAGQSTTPCLQVKNNGGTAGVNITGIAVGIGTTAPIRGLVVSGANHTTTAEWILQNTTMPANNRNFNFASESTGGSNGQWYLRTLNDAGTNAQTYFMILDNTGGDVLFGNSFTDAGYKVDIQKSGSSGTLRVFDQTATTGATRVIVSLGAADSATTATLTNAGTTKSGGYQSSDGTAGVSQTCTILSITSFVVKNGLIVSCS